MLFVELSIKNKFKNYKDVELEVGNGGGRKKEEKEKETDVTQIRDTNSQNKNKKLHPLCCWCVVAFLPHTTAVPEALSATSL